MKSVCVVHVSKCPQCKYLIKVFFYRILFILFAQFFFKQCRNLHKWSVNMQIIIISSIRIIRLMKKKIGLKSSYQWIFLLMRPLHNNVLRRFVWGILDRVISGHAFISVHDNYYYYYNPDNNNTNEEFCQPKEFVTQSFRAPHVSLFRFVGRMGAPAAMPYC